MRLRSAPGLVTAAIMSLLAGSFAGGATPQSSTRATWHGLQTVVITGPRCEARNVESFTWVEETDTFSHSRWVSKRTKWDNYGSCRGAAGLAIVNGVRADFPWSVECVNRGQVDLIDFNGPSSNPTCVQRPSDVLFPIPAPSVYSGPPNFSPVDRSALRDGCALNRRTVESSDGTRRVTTQSITLDEANVSAKVFVTSDAVPSPGGRFHVEGRANVPVRWKIAIVESSQLRGYATNADVDLAFFEIYNLPSLRGRYGTRDPDLIFDPSKYEPPFDLTHEWKRPYPDSGPRKWSILESTGESRSVSVDGTMMDFGAHGELQVYVSSKCGGGWIQADVEEPASAVAGITLPLDDADGNFIPDSLKAYAGLAALDDTDNAPVGDGTKGDGFTAFEEYRGFVTARGIGCNSPLAVEHGRTNPAVKDLFVRAADPVLWGAVTKGAPFEAASGIPLHMICPAQYVDDATRIVNFTVQGEWPGGIRGAELTQDFPQHGLLLVNERLDGLNGMSFQRLDDRFGPIRDNDRVAVDVAAIVASARGEPALPYIRRTAIHEIGHAIGIQHHGDSNLRGPVVLLNMPVCPPGMTEGTVAGDRACVATAIATRGGQNSGNAFCPMRYTTWAWYVPPGASLVPAGMVDFRPVGSFSWLRRRQLPGYVSRIDEVHRYRTDLDDAIVVQSDWKFCAAPTGTRLNALPGDENHAGDSTRFCTHQIRVNDKQ